MAMKTKDLCSDDRALLVWLHQLESERATLQRILTHMPTHVDFFEAKTSQSADLISMWDKLQELDTIISNLITTFEKTIDLQDG